MKPFKGTAVLIAIIPVLAWGDGSILCPCLQPSVKISPAYFTGDVRLEALLQEIDPERIADGTLRFNRMNSLTSANQYRRPHRCPISNELVNA